LDRIFIRFPSDEVKVDVLQTVAFSTQPELRPKLLYSQPDVMLASATDLMRVKLEAAGAKVFEDVTFKVLSQWEDDPRIDRWATAGAPSSFGEDMCLQDVIEQVRAPNAWGKTRGRGITIAIVDTGVAGGFDGISSQRRSAVDLPTAHYQHHWSDSLGHGTMCAAIAGSSRGDGGRYDGIAPDATILSARTTLKSTDLADIFDELLRARAVAALSGPLVVSNSYGLETCEAPSIFPEDHPYMTGILTAISRAYLSALLLATTTMTCFAVMTLRLVVRTPFGGLIPMIRSSAWEP
jgi:serine protease AprX